MSTGRPLPPAKLLHHTQSFPNLAGWGFLLDLDRLREYAEGEVPDSTVTDPDELLELRQVQMGDLMWDLQWECHEIWPCFRMSGIMQTSFEGKPAMILAIVRCTRRDDKFLPPQDKIQKMKELLASHGFTKEPGWFIED